MAEITADTINALAEKIDSLELTDTEQAVFEQVFARAAACESEVEGFIFGQGIFGQGIVDESSATARKLVGAVGFLPDGTPVR